MKNKFLTIANFFIVLFALSFFTSCENDDFVPEFTLQEASEQVVFLNSFSNEYVLSADTKNNVAERFVWNTPSFGVQTEISYQLEGSVSDTFSSIDYDSGTITDNNQAVSVGALLAIAKDILGLDTDPNTTDDQGNPNNTGVVYFRVKAFPGSGLGQDAITTISDTAALNISLVEYTGVSSGVEISNWSIIGSAITGDDTGWGMDLPMYVTNQENVFVAYVTFHDGKFKFRKDKSWDENYGDNGADGTLEASGADIEVSAGTYKITFDLGNLTYAIDKYSWGITGDATPTGWPANPQIEPDIKFNYDPYSDTWKVIIALTDGDIKFRTNDSWDFNYGDNGADGTLDVGGTNITVTKGNYIVTLDLNELTYSLEKIDHIWGITGDATSTGWPANPQTVPDIKLTRDFSTQENIWIINNIVLTDGDIKFRADDSWDVNYGDNDADGSLENGGANITVTAGTYDIVLDLSDPNSPTYSLTKK